MITNQDIIYFVVTDRFRRGASSPLRPDPPLQPDNPRGWHGGNFTGVIDALPYLTHLGITALWITPVYLNINEYYGSYGYHGYWALDFEKVDPHLYDEHHEKAEAGRHALKHLIKHCHGAGIKVILDMVVNHTGYGYREKDYPDKRFSAEHFNVNQPGDEIEGELAGLPDLDHDQPFVADYFIQNIIDWINDTGIDAIRMDTAKHVEPMFWYYFKSVIKTNYPQITLIGEVLREDVWDIPYLADFQRRFDFDSVFDFPLRKKIIEVFVNDAPLTWLARPRLSDSEAEGVLDLDSDYTNPFRLVTLLDNHDMGSRFYTTILDRIGHWDRLLAQRIMCLSATFLFTTRGIPQLYYGNEIAMEGGRDPDNRADFPWLLIEDGLEPGRQFIEERTIYKHLRRLIALRKQHRALSSGYLLTLWVDTFVYVYLRACGDDLAIVAINNGRQDMPVPLAIPFARNGNVPPRLINLISTTNFCDALDADYATCAEQGVLPVSVPAKSARVLVADKS